MRILLFLSIFVLLFSAEHKDSQEYKLGKEFYFQACAACHGKTGTPNQELHLAIRPRNLNKTILLRSQIYRVVKNGAREYGAHSSIMPAFKYMYDDKTLHAISTYVYMKYAKYAQTRIDKHLKEADKLSKTEEKNMLLLGKQIFKKTCSKCHGKMGNADSLYVKGSKIDHDFIYPYNLQKILLSEDQIFLFAKFGSYYWGSDKSDMPEWKNKYSDAELKSVAKFIHESIKQN